MFRDPILWSTLKQSLSGGDLGSQDLSFWHAGCSTGEEAYTMGIVLREAGLAQRYKSLATDISNESLTTAQGGEYHKIKMIEFEKNYREFDSQGQFSKYYKRLGEYVQFEKSLVSNVTFKYHNLITDPFAGKYDIIFCRNVMIYFDNDAKIKLFEKFHRALKPGGLLIVGFYDAVNALIDPTRFELVNTDSKIFKARQLVLS
jgi:chemotaxis protein methyltransferase CheR